MAANRWIFSIDRLSNTPSRKCGIDNEKESNYRQQAASLIQDMGQKLQVTQLCINTAIVYMHRFYIFHSFTKFNRTSMSGACLFLAAKVEEQPRKLEHVIRTGYMCTHRDHPQLDVKSDSYLELAQELVIDENILLQTLGFEITVDHPHTHIVKTCNLVRASKDLAQTSYFLATNSLHLTSMCLQYPPTIVACVCIHLACKWSSFEIPQSSEGKAWYYYVDTSVTSAMLEEITQDFLTVLEKCPSKMRKKLTNHKTSMEELAQNIPERKQNEKYPLPTAALPSCTSAGLQSPFVNEKPPGSDKTNNGSKFRPTNHDRMLNQPSASATLSTVNQPQADQTTQLRPPLPATGFDKDSFSGQPTLRRVKTEGSTLSTKEYFERKERERLERDASRIEAKSTKDTLKLNQEALLVGALPELSNADFVKVEHESEIVRAGSTSVDYGRGPSASKEQLNIEVSKGQHVLISSRPSNSPKFTVHRLEKSAPTASKSLGMGDPSDQRPVNIFDRFQSATDSKSSHVDQFVVGGKLNVGTGSTVPMEVSFDNESCLDSAKLPSQQETKLKLEQESSLAIPVLDTCVSSLSLQQGRSFNGDHKLGQPSRRSGQDNMALDGAAAGERRKSSRHDSTGTLSPLVQLTRINQPSIGEPASLGTIDPKYYEQRSSRRKLPSDSSQVSPLKIKLSVTGGTSLVESPTVTHRTHADVPTSGQSKTHDATDPQCSLFESQERIRLKLNLSGGKVEKLSESVASPSTSGANTGVKLVLSKDKLSGEYQPGSVGHHHHHRHSHRDHHHVHKHMRADAESRLLPSAEVSSRKRAAAVAASDISLKPPPDKVHRSDTLFGNGHRLVISSRSSHQYQQETCPVSLTSNNVFPTIAPAHIPSTYRVAPPPPPPPPPPPLPLDEPLAPPPPPMP